MRPVGFSANLTVFQSLGLAITSLARRACPSTFRFGARACSDAVQSLRFSNRVFRWYAGCCRTPIANTASSARVPFFGLVHSFIGVEAEGRSRNGILDEILGPPLCRIYERSATGPLPPDAPAPASLGLYALRAAKVFGWWWHGLGRPNPFFDDRTGAPLSQPRVVTGSKRAAL